MDAKQIGEVIKKARKNKKITQTQLGELLGIGTKAVSDYEKGKIKVIPFEKRAKMSSVLNIPVSELLYDNEKMACISTNEAVDELRENRLIKAVNAELEEVTMNYAGIEEGFEVYRCSHCQADVYHTIYWYDYCPGCGRKIKEWK